MSILPPPADASRVSCFLADHPRWSAYWNKKHGLWRVAEDDPDSDLYAESNNADTVLGYIEAHAREVDQPRIMPGSLRPAAGMRYRALRDGAGGNARSGPH